MADDAKGGKPREGAEPVFGTMQLPRGAVLDPMATIKTIAGEPAPDGAAPILPTAMPHTGAPMPIGAPPAMPAEWRYTYGAEIARGGMGHVVEATDTVLGRTVALKEALSLDPDAVQRFHRETRITARLEHPSIVPVHDAGIAPNGAPYYVMRKIGGRPLEELVGRSPELADRLALLPHIVAAANAIAHAHERGVVHRDIKPSNILAGELGETIVIDWGLAKAIGESDEATPRMPTAPQVMDDDNVKTRAGVVYGTPGFMAPEQLRGAPVDERCDVYALGATLYHLLARRPPHYSKVGGEMMKAAVEGPPTPLRELVPGVSPELATIVDKALAHDRTARYPDARALADDLQRFLTGQLVASHHYSTREKIVRWVKQNRSLVGVSAAAILALLVIGTLAVSRIVAARDRADDQAQIARDQTKLALAEREKVTESLQQLTLTDARAKAADSPTRAVAMVKPLVASMWWREARDVAAAARPNGIAYTMPASPHTLSLELSRDGTRALAAGDDGIVRIYDLARRTSKTVADAKTATPARFGDAEHTVVLFRDTHLTLVDVASGSHRDVEAPSAIVRLEVSGPIAYWIDPQHAVWKLDLAGGAPSKLALDEPIDAIVPSPDGRWVVLAGKVHLLLLDRTNSTLPPESIADGAMRDVAWAADASHVVALTEDELVDIAMQPSPSINHRFTVGARRAIAYSNGHLFTTGPTGVAMITREDSKSRAATGDYTLGVREARGNTIVAGKPTAITLLSDDGDRTLSVPAPLRISRVEATPRGPYVIAATEGRVLVWDLDAVLARHVAVDAPSGASFVTGDQVIVTYLDAPAQWIDLRTDKVSPLGMIAGLTQIAAPPDGLRAVVIDSTHHARIVTPVGDPVDLDGEIDHALFLDDRRLVVATATGMVRLDDPKQDRGTALVKRGAAVVALAGAASLPNEGGWIAAAYADRVLVRVSVSAKPDVANLELKAAPPRGGLAIDNNGEVVFGSGNELYAWHADGSSPVSLWTSTRLIVSVAYVGPNKVLAIAADGNAVFVDTRAKTVEPSAATITNPTFTADGGLVASLVAPNGVDIIDPIAKDRWSLAPPKGPPLMFAEISPDGRRVLASTNTGLLVWTLALPASADATSRWIDTLTNAIDRGPAAPLDWK